MAPVDNLLLKTVRMQPTISPASKEGVPTMLELRAGGCRCGRARFRAEVDPDRLLQCSCTIRTMKEILRLPAMPEVLELLPGKHALTVYTFGTGVAQHAFRTHRGMHAFHVPRSQPDRISVDARCLETSTGRASSRPGSSTTGTGRTPQRRRIAEGGHIPPPGSNGSVTVKAILDRAPE
jgi:hypothetical protein